MNPLLMKRPSNPRSTGVTILTEETRQLLLEAIGPPDKPPTMHTPPREDLAPYVRCGLLNECYARTGKAGASAEKAHGGGYYYYPTLRGYEALFQAS